MSQTVTEQGLPPAVETTGEILENRKVAPVTWIMKIHAPDAAPRIHAGQFMNLETAADSFLPLLRRPIPTTACLSPG